MQNASTLAQFASDIGTVLQAWFGPVDQWHWLHANYLGAIEAVTDANGQLVWQSRYGPFGQLVHTVSATVSKGGATPFVLNLRLPGQYEDRETGLFYNGQRYYDPQRGRYLTPDPLSTPDGPNPYTYVTHNPLKYIDPTGLILFAFDGTGNNSNPNSKNIDSSNVALLYDFFDETALGQKEKFYQRGIGTDPEAWDITNTYQQAIAAQGHDFVNGQLDNLNEFVNQLPDPTQTIVVDIVGFSRGAAEVRDFANRVLKKYKNKEYGKHCIDFRFMGLFDTVSQFGASGARNNEYDFSIPPE